MKKIIDFFVKNSNFKEQEIVEIERIHNGFTNEIYHLKLSNGHEYKIRFASTNQYINRELEKLIEFEMNKDNIIYYSDNGNYIKKWFSGVLLEKEFLNNKKMNEILTFINKFQNLNTKNIEIAKPVYVLLDHVVIKELIKPLLAYKKIINEDVKTNNNVLCHNDLSSNNTIVNNDEINIIDFEWASFNHPYWDIANLIKDLELTIEEVEKFECLMTNFDYKLLLKIIYATHFYTYYWTLKVDETPKIVEYRDSVIKQIFYWYNILVKKGIVHA